MTKYIAIALLMLCTCTAFAKGKTFPASVDSIPQELRMAEFLGLRRYETERDVAAAVERGELVPLTVRCSKKLPKSRRYATPAAVAFVQKLSDELYAATKGRLVVDSAVRSADVQKRLCRTNINAVQDSPHEFGNTIDVGRKLSRRQYRWLIGRLGYYIAQGRCLVVEEKSCVHIMTLGEGQ